MTIRLLIAETRPECRERLRAIFTEADDVEVCALARDGQEAVQFAHSHRPQIALIAADLAALDGCQTTEAITAALLPTQCLIVADAPSPEGLRCAMRAGARDYLPLTLAPEAFRLAVREIAAQANRHQNEKVGGETASRLVAVTGAKGGIGKTTVAINLAAALHAETGLPTVLVDLYTQFGDVALMLNLTPKRALSDLAALNPAEIDDALMESCLMEHPSGLFVLPCANQTLAWDALPVGLLESVIPLLKRRFRFVVLDVPPFLSPLTLYTLSYATVTLAIANLHDITTIHDTRQLLQALQGKVVARDALKLVLNRVSARNRLSAGDVTATLGYPIAAQIVNDGRLVPQSVNEGVPFVLSAPKSPVAQSVRALARSLLP